MWFHEIHHSWPACGYFYPLSPTGGKSCAIEPVSLGLQIGRSNLGWPIWPLGIFLRPGDVTPAWCSAAHQTCFQSSSYKGQNETELLPSSSVRLCQMERSFQYLEGFSEKEPKHSSLWLRSDKEKGTITAASTPATSFKGRTGWGCRSCKPVKGGGKGVRWHIGGEFGRWELEGGWGGRNVLDHHQLDQDC